MWIFGYGSLLFKPPPHYDLRVPGYIKGYVRRFWQSSNDHRGTREAPGRVVTLIERKFWDTLDDPHDAPDITWGVCYRIRSDKEDEVREYLDYREKNGYTVHIVDFHVAPNGLIEAVQDETRDKQSQEELQLMVHALRAGDLPIIPCTAYIGTPDNEAFVGPEPPKELAAHILKSRGPSGENAEYLFELDKALNELAPQARDNHVEDLVRFARAMS